VWSVLFCNFEADVMSPVCETFGRLLAELRDAPQFSTLARWLVEHGAVDTAVLVQVGDTPPHMVASAGRHREWPWELASDAVAAGSPKQLGEWLAVPEPGCPLVAMVRLRDKSLAAELSSMLPSALGLVQSILQRENERNQATTLLEIISGWQRSDDLAELLANMAEAATRLFASDRATIFLWDKPNKMLVGRPALGLPDGMLRIPDHVGVVGEVVSTGGTLVVNRGDDQQAIYAGVDSQTGYRTESLLCVPLVTPAGDTLGAFELINKHNGHFDDADKAGLRELARHAALALAETQEWTRILTQNRQLVSDATDVEMVGHRTRRAAAGRKRHRQRSGSTQLARSESPPQRPVSGR
jgi:putative methionine-R-sulfoxide reductase with GAF domain